MHWHHQNSETHLTYFYTANWGLPVMYWSSFLFICSFEQKKHLPLNWKDNSTILKWYSTKNDVMCLESAKKSAFGKSPWLCPTALLYTGCRRQMIVRRFATLNWSTSLFLLKNCEEEQKLIKLHCERVALRKGYATQHYRCFLVLLLFAIVETKAVAQVWMPGSENEEQEKGVWEKYISPYLLY